MSIPEQAYEVEEIVGRRVFSGKVLYLTKWKNFPLQEATWESVKVLKQYRHLIKLYNEHHRTNDPTHTSQPDHQFTPIKTESPTPPTQPLLKKRGRPPRKRLPELHPPQDKDQKYNQSQDKQPQHSHIKESRSTEKSRSKMEEKDDVEENRKEVSLEAEGEEQTGIRIYCCGVGKEGEVDYIIERGNFLKKCSSSEMLRQYPGSLVKFLQSYLKKQWPFPQME